ncbi:MAG: DNA-3-methyladenine glycosylase 2 family protein [Pseudomonadota bacterium]
MTAPNTAVLRQACETLAGMDEALSNAYQAVDLPNWRSRPANYQSLAQIVVYQLISTKAADAIWARLLARHPDFTAPKVLSDDQDALRACGLSRPKLAHLNSIARAVETGVLDFEDLAQVSEASARERLLSVKGIGPWTADTFLMTSLGHLDAFPHGDVGLMESYRRLTDANTRLTSKAFSEHAEAWRPYRAVAAHLLYEWLHLMRD